jgi:putative aminopeptidase FrvX
MASVYITNIGGIDARVLPGTPVIVHASRDKGRTVWRYRHAASESSALMAKAVAWSPMKYLFIDTGLASGEVSKRVRIGDRVSFGTEPIEMSGRNVKRSYSG